MLREHSRLFPEQTRAAGDILRELSLKTLKISSRLRMAICQLMKRYSFGEDASEGYFKIVLEGEWRNRRLGVSESSEVVNGHVV